MTWTIEALDLNHLRLFERVAALGGFSAAARALGLPKSNVSRAVALLEVALGARLFQRTTRSVVLTPAGAALLERCAPMLDGIDEAVEYVSSFAGAPRGHIKLSAGIGFGVNVLSGLATSMLLTSSRLQKEVGHGSIRQSRRCWKASCLHVLPRT